MISLLKKIPNNIRKAFIREEKNNTPYLKIIISNDNERLIRYKYCPKSLISYKVASSDELVSYEYIVDLRRAKATKGEEIPSEKSHCIFIFELRKIDGKMSTYWRKCLDMSNIISILDGYGYDDIALNVTEKVAKRIFYGFNCIHDWENLVSKWIRET